MAASRATRALALTAALAAAGVVALAVAERREIELRYWLWRLERDPSRRAIEAIWTLGAAEDPRYLAIWPRHGDLEVRVSTSATGASPGQPVPWRATIRNKADRRLVVVGELAVEALFLGPDQGSGHPVFSKQADVGAVLLPGAALSFSGSAIAGEREPLASDARASLTAMLWLQSGTSVKSFAWDERSLAPEPGR